MPQLVSVDVNVAVEKLTRMDFVGIGGVIAYTLQINQKTGKLYALETNFAVVRAAKNTQKS